METALQRTPYAHTFYPIKNARLAGENKASLNEVGVYALDEKTLVVDYWSILFPTFSKL